jgi:hypothetical protein
LAGVIALGAVVAEIGQIVEIGASEIQAALHGRKHSAKPFAIAAGIADGHDALALLSRIRVLLKLVFPNRAGLSHLRIVSQRGMLTSIRARTEILSKPPISSRRVITITAICAAFLAPAIAHDLYRGESRIFIHGREVHDTLTLNLLDFPGIDQNGDKVVSKEEFEQSFDRVYGILQQHYFLRSNGPPLRVTRQHYEIFQDHVLSLELLYVFPQDVIALEVHSTLNHVLGPTYVHLVTVVLNGKVQEDVLGATHPVAFFTSAGTSRLQTAGRFIWLGIQHIALGYDHLAFLLGLLVATSSLRSLVKVITSFTIAHSITLALATFDIVILPTRLTESMIALSIIYVAAENLIRNRAIERYRITFLFGLIHGFGFSNVLREMQLPRGHLALSLFSFNVGVEIGQLIFVVLLFPLIEDLIQSGWTKLRPVVSGIVGCLAVYWFIQRAFFS